jgi:hypothetical protein
MKEFPTEGEELKKQLKLARKLPLNFGYNPGTTDDDDQFMALHKRKPPEVLGRIALHDGAGTKAAFGTLEVKGNIVMLTCEREIPQLAKRIKKLLRMNKMNLNVQVLDHSGNVIDAVIEEIEPLPESDDDIENGEAVEAETARAPDTEAPPRPSEPAIGQGAETGPAASELAARLKTLRSGLQSAPAPAAAKLERAFAAAVGLVRSGDLDKAASMIGMIETTLARIAPGTTPGTVS